MITAPLIFQNMSPKFIKNLLAKTVDNGSNCLCKIFQLFGMNLYPYMDRFPFDSKDIPTLINLSLAMQGICIQKGLEYAE